MDPVVTLPTGIATFARQLRDVFGPGVRLLSVELDSGETMGKLPEWWSLCSHLDDAKPAQNAPYCV
jgi:hypothetical protein